MSKSAASQAWDLYDVYTDLEDVLAEKVRERCTEPAHYDKDTGALVWIRRDTLLWEVLQEYFARDFDAQATMESLCASYGIENIYGEEV